MKRKVFDIIQIGDKSNLVSRGFDIFITLTIISNILVMFLQTFDELEVAYPFFKCVEIFTTLVFCIEYILRIWTADYLYPNLSEFKSRLRFLFSYDGVVDLLTIIPAFFLTGFVVFRMLRVVRIFHLFRINAQYDSFSVITSVLWEKKRQILSSLFIVIILILGSSLCMYSAEHEVQPNVFRNAFSGIWWAVSTVLTVGYGDIYPVTLMGRLMAIIIAILGVGVVAIPTGIISAGFVEQYQRKASLADYKDADIKDIIELLVDTSMQDKTVEDLNKINGFTILLIVRDDLSILPKDTTMVKLNDIVIVKLESK